MQEVLEEVPLQVLEPQTQELYGKLEAPEALQQVQVHTLALQEAEQLWGQQVPVGSPAYVKNVGVPNKRVLSNSVLSVGVLSR